MKLPHLYQMTKNGEVLAQVDQISFCYIDASETFPEIRIMPSALLDTYANQELRPISEEAFITTRLQAEEEIIKKLIYGKR